MKKLFCPSEYIALPGCPEEEVIEIGPSIKVPLDVSAIKLNRQAIIEYFKGLPKYHSWVDFLPFNDGNEVLARMAVIIGSKVGAWEVEENPLSYHHPQIIHAGRMPKPSRGDLKEEPAFPKKAAEDGSPVT